MSFRSLFAVALAALVATPALAAAPSKRTTAPSAPARTSTASSSGITLGGSIGYESGDLDGLALRVDGVMPIQPLTPKVALSFVGSVGYSRFSLDEGFAEATWNLFKLIPAARFTMPVAPQISLYGDAGLGLYYASFTTKMTLPPPLPSREFSDSATGFLMRFGVGGMYDVNPQLKLTGEIGVMPYFGDADTTNWTFAIGALFGI